jgi:hypothetical protein
MTSLFVFLLLAPFAVQAQEFRETAVPNSQIAAVVRDVAQWHDMRHPDCRFLKAKGSVVVEKDSDSTAEHWTVEACSGKSFTYRVVVFPEPDGGVTDMVGDVDRPSSDTNAMLPPPDPAECAEKQRKLDALNASNDPNTDYSQMAQLAADLAVCNVEKAAP